MAQVFVTEAATKPRPKLSGKASFRAALRGQDPSALREAIASFKASPQFDQTELNEALLSCTKADQGEFVTVLVQEGADPNAGSFRTPLQWALMMGKEASVEALVNAGADINFGKPPPITIAASMGRVKSVGLLIDKGVNIAAQDNDRRTALDLAETYRHREIVDILKRSGCHRNLNAILGHH